MNRTKASCGHEVIAVGCPGSAIRTEIENTVCVSCRTVKSTIYIVESTQGDVIQCFSDKLEAKVFADQLNGDGDTTRTWRYKVESYTVK